LTGVGEIHPKLNGTLKVCFNVTDSYLFSDALRLGVKAGMVRVCVAGKTV